MAGTTTAQAATEGTVRFAKQAESDFDVFTSNPTPERQQWMRDHYWRMKTFAPYFDSRLSWFPNAWTYKDLYAIYTDNHDGLAGAHPEWILKDSSGKRLYIPWGCNGTSCPQYAADIGNPAFRQYWIDQARQQLAPGYKGLFVDDVNMEFRVGNASGQQVAPYDPRTGQTMTFSDWRRYMAEFAEQIRAAFPSHEIVHNAIWFSGHDDPYIQRQLRAANYIDIERGVGDAGLNFGGGTYGFETLLAHVDWIHAQGAGVVFDANDDSMEDTASEREYNLASYFLVSNGNDGVGTDPGGTPTDWWSGYDVYLGAAKGPRYAWNGVLRRDFDLGTVLVNQPKTTAKTLSLGGSFKNLNGDTVTSVSLGAAQAAILRLPDAPPTSDSAGTDTGTDTGSDSTGTDTGTTGGDSTTSESANTAPDPTITAPGTQTTWRVGQQVSFAGSAVDAQDGPLPASALNWDLVLVDCSAVCHEHALRSFPGVAGGSFDAPDHGYPSHLRLKLTATDSRGLTGTTSVRLDPRTVNLTLASAPLSGLSLTLNGVTQAAPFTRTVIEGSSNSVSAPWRQKLNGTIYQWLSWSDGRGRSHSLKANTTMTLTATFFRWKR